MRVVLGTARTEDIHHVMDNLRTSDRYETMRTGQLLGRPADHDLKAEILRINSLRRMDAFYLKSGECIAILGVHPITDDGDLGAIWLLATPAFDAHWRPALRAARRYVESVRPRWRNFGNIVPEEMGQRLRWLRHLGFDIAPPEANPDLQGIRQFWWHPLGPART